MDKQETELLEKTLLISSIKAFKQYYEMTNGAWLYVTPEYWHTSQVAIRLRKKLPKYSIFIENCILEFRKYATKEGGKPSKRMKSGRTDISIWKYLKTKEDYTPKCIIEVKRSWAWNSTTMAPGIDRLCGSMIETKKSMNKAYFLVLSDDEDESSKALKQKFQNRSDNIYKDNRAYQT